ARLRLRRLRGLISGARRGWLRRPVGWCGAARARGSRFARWPVRRLVRLASARRCRARFVGPPRLIRRGPAGRRRARFAGPWGGRGYSLVAAGVGPCEVHGGMLAGADRYFLGLLHRPAVLHPAGPDLVIKRPPGFERRRNKLPHGAGLRSL